MGILLKCCKLLFVVILLNLSACSKVSEPAELPLSMDIADDQKSKDEDLARGMMRLPNVRGTVKAPAPSDSEHNWIYE